MAQYIDKSALVAEIEKCYKEYSKKAKTYIDDANYWIGKADAYHYMLVILDSLKVKEVDLEKEYDRYYEQERHIQTFKLAKHFFELGLKAQKGE